MCLDWIGIHYNQLIKTLKEEKDNNNNNTYDDKLNNTWLMFGILPCNKSILWWGNINVGDRIILLAGYHKKIQ